MRLHTTIGRTNVGKLINGNGVFLWPTPLGTNVAIHGGPFSLFRYEITRGICLAPEVRESKLADVMVPTRDFGIPSVPDMLNGLDKCLDFLLAREPVYVGCMGGIGRTGTFIACFAKLMGSKNPVNDVRATYLGHAVETKAQEKFVDDLQFPFALKFKAARLKCVAAIYGTRKQVAFNDEVITLHRDPSAD